MKLIDSNGVTIFEDDSGVVLFLDDLGNWLGDPGILLPQASH